MVANTHHPVIDICWSAHRDRWWFSSCAVHLHAVLKKIVVQPQDRYKNILVIVTGLLALALIFNLHWLAIVSVSIGAVSIFFATAAKAIEWGWLKLAQGLGWINSRILLSIIYFVFLLPVAWISRLFTNDPLTLRKRKTSTLFVDRNHLYTKKDLENIW
jgi:hypothetical protein